MSTFQIDETRAVKATRAFLVVRPAWAISTG